MKICWSCLSIDNPKSLLIDKPKPIQKQFLSEDEPCLVPHAQAMWSDTVEAKVIQGMWQSLYHVHVLFGHDYLSLGERMIVNQLW